jgi:YD repeat-containing protein
MFDRDRVGLRGPVKSCTEETTHPAVTDAEGKSYPEFRSAGTTEYDRDGRVLATRTNSRDGQGWVSYYEYDASGRLLKIASELEGKAFTETIYSYDQEGRLQSIRDAARPESPATFSYDEQGRRTKTEVSRRADHRPNTLIYRPPFEAAGRAPNLLGGGTSTTIFDEHDRATEVQVRDANGELVTRTLRTYDAEGHVIEEKQIMENPELGFPLEDPAETPAESGPSADQRRQALREKILKFMGGPEQHWFSNRYDTRGRLSHTSFRARRHQGEIEITYNEHGDRESAIGQDSPLDTESDPNNATPSPSYSETRYSYQYDQHDNWIEKVESQGSSPDSPFQSSPILKRTLAYY